VVYLEVVMKAASFVAGFGIGAAVALLFAPRSGNETREAILEKAEEGRQYAERRAQELHDRAQELRDQATDAVERGTEVFNRQKKAVTSAVRAAKDTYVRESQTNGSSSTLDPLIS
jgi:gas vesicle protein